MRAQHEILSLREKGLSFRAIAVKTGRSRSQVHRLCESAYTEYTAAHTANIAAVLGGELARLDSLVRAASAVLASPRATPGEKMRAVGEIRRCAEARIRWLGAGSAEKILVDTMSRDDLAQSEVAALTDEALDRELEVLGWKKTPAHGARVPRDPAAEGAS